MTRAKPVVRVVFAVAMMAVGLTHFTSPDYFLKMVPAALPAPQMLVDVSGFFEILGGAGLLIARVRFWAAWGLIALFVAVFPANVNMAVNHIHGLPDWAAWGRLPFQALFIAGAFWLRKP